MLAKVTSSSIESLSKELIFVSFDSNSSTYLDAKMPITQTNQTKLQTCKLAATQSKKRCKGYQHSCLVYSNVSSISFVPGIELDINTDKISKNQTNQIEIWPISPQ